MFGINYLAQNDIHVVLSTQWHSLMTFLVSFLVVAKINLSYKRYMEARRAIGGALSRLRELHQLAMSYTFQGTFDERHPHVYSWRVQLTSRIIDLMDCTMRVTRNKELAQFLARDEHDGTQSSDDPLLHVHAMRLHLYHGSAASKLALLERTKLMEELDKFVDSYRGLLVLTSTPLPPAFLQLSHTLVLLWTFTLPFVAREVVEESIMTYVIITLLTYAFIGLEIVSSRLGHPFGDGRNDLNVMGMRQALLRGIKLDLELFGESISDNGDQLMDFSLTKVRMPTFPPALYHNRKVAPRKGKTEGREGTVLGTMCGTAEPSNDETMEDRVYISMNDVL